MEITRIIPEIGLTEESTISSLKYGRLIQDAILCKRPGLREMFGDLVILYQPKNILSGDFYFYTQKGNIKYLAVCDCFGHGISGALLTILGHKLINRAIQKYDCLSTIMAYVNGQMIEAFAKSDVKQGMDMVVLAFNTETQEVEFCGARRPLWLLREGELTRHKTDRSSIGDNVDMVWTKQSLSLEPDDMLYMFTDGYTDQFNHHNNRKLGPTTLQKILEKTTDMKSHVVQDILYAVLEDFRGANVYTDDSLIIGVRAQELS